MFYSCECFKRGQETNKMESLYMVLYLYLNYIGNDKYFMIADTYNTELACVYECIYVEIVHVLG